MIGIIELNFDRPVGRGVRVTPKGGEFGAHRHYGGHKGVDFEAPWGTGVKAIEKGIVVCSTECPGSKEKANYGYVVVIDHTPQAGKYQRHVYSLSAHLDTKIVSKGQEIDKGKTIGRSGNNGTRQSYSSKRKRDQGGYHLHFEIIDSPKELDWSGRNFHALSLRENPMGAYIGSTLCVDYSRPYGDLSGAEQPSWKDSIY